jgi:hypothetical protein
MGFRITEEDKLASTILGLYIYIYFVLVSAAPFRIVVCRR